MGLKSEFATQSMKPSSRKETISSVSLLKIPTVQLRNILFTTKLVELLSTLIVKLKIMERTIHTLLAQIVQVTEAQTMLRKDMVVQNMLLSTSVRETMKQNVIQLPVPFPSSIARIEKRKY